MTEQTAPTGRVTFLATSYDATGNLTSWLDAASTPTGAAFDELGRRRTLWLDTLGPDFTQLSFEYDRQGRLIEKTDGRGHTTSIHYDLLGRVESVTDGLQRTRQTFEYDEVGNVLSLVDGAGHRVERDYDALGNVTEERDLTAGTTSAFQYDLLGRLVWTRGPDGTTETYTYDDLDRLVTRSTVLGGTERFVYDEDGLLRQHVQPPGLNAPAGTSLVVNYEYDARGILERVADPEAGTFLFEADPLGRPVRRTGPGGAEWRAEYTPEGFSDLTLVSVPGEVTEVIDYSAHDDRGYPTSIVTSEGTTSIGYSPLGRVTSVTYPDSTSESFTYDDAGNRTRRIASSGDDWTYHYDAADQLTHVTATSGGATLESFTHDDAGRRTGHTVTATGANTTYGYDGFGRLTSVSRAGYSATLQYGPDGRRTSRTETGAGAALYPTPRLEQRSGTGYRTLRAGGVGPALAEIETTGSGPLTHAFHRDPSQHLAHVVTTDEAGTSASEGPPRRWTAFGTLRSGTSIIERGFASQVTEGATGLLYMAARHYDPATGRFLQVDPLGIDAAELYAYAANNPYAFWDPTGLIPAPITIGDVATIGAETFIPFVSAYNAYERGDYGTAALDATLDVVGIAATGGFGYAAFKGFRLAQRVDRVFDVTRGAGALPRFTQTTASSAFRHGPFAGRSVGDVAAGLRSGAIKRSELPVDVIVRGENALALNTRSLLALRRGGIDPGDFTFRNVTGNPTFERILTERLTRNGLTDAGTDALRITGAGPGASSLR